MRKWDLSKQFFSYPRHFYEKLKLGPVYTLLALCAHKSIYQVLRKWSSPFLFSPLTFFFSKIDLGSTRQRLFAFHLSQHEEFFFLDKERSVSVRDLSLLGFSGLFIFSRVNVCPTRSSNFCWQGDFLNEGKNFRLQLNFLHYFCWAVIYALFTGSQTSTDVLEFCQFSAHFLLHKLHNWVSS